jgi:hypothetical protein
LGRDPKPTIRIAKLTRVVRSGGLTIEIGDARITIDAAIDGETLAMIVGVLDARRAR